MIIVQIGTNRANDDVTEIVNSYKDSLTKFIAVEPLQIHHNAIRECYKHIPSFILEGVAITPTETDERLVLYYHPADAPGYEITSTSKEHILKHNKPSNNHVFTKDDILELIVDCLTINKLLEKYNIDEVDMLYIDVEGLDLELIKSIDFGVYIIHNIAYEHHHINKKDSIKFLESKGYSVNTGYGKGKSQYIATKKGSRLIKL